MIDINEAYIPPSAGAVSLGFAIPAATAVDVADQLLANGTATMSRERRTQRAHVWAERFRDRARSGSMRA